MSRSIERRLYALGRHGWDRLPRPIREQIIPLAQRGFRAKLALSSRLRNGSPGAPVIVVATMRSGSNLLADLLDAHPDVRMLGEGLNPGTRYGLPEARPAFFRATGAESESPALAHLNWLFAQCPGLCPGVKLLAEQLKQRRVRIADVAQTFPNARWIVLYRHSLAHQLVSLKRAQRSGEFVASTAGAAAARTAIDVTASEFRDFFRKTRAVYEEILAALCAYPSLILEYESLIDNPQGIFDERVWGFLGLRPALVETRLRQQRADSLREDLLHFEDLRTLIEGDESRLSLSKADVQSA